MLLSALTVSCKCGRIALVISGVLLLGRRLMEQMQEVVKYLKALVYLQINSKSDEAQQKPEILLHKAGIKAKEIADILGKTEAAVAKAITRSKTNGEKEVSDGQ